MKFVQLGELIQPAKNIKAGQSSFPVLSMTMHEGLVLQSGRFKKKISSQDLSQYKVVQRQQLVVGFPIDEGVLDFQTVVDSGIVSPAYGVWDLISSKVVDPGYLGKFLKSPIALSYYKTKLRGTTARRRSLPRNIFEELLVPLPPLEEQKRIAKILDQVSKSIEEVNAQLSKFDELIQAHFHQQFSEEFIITEPLGDVASLIGGKSIVAKDSEIDSKFKVLKVSAITSGKFLSNQVKNLPADYQPPRAHLIRPNDLLISRASGSSELVGATILVPDDIPENLALPDKIWRFDWKNSQSSPHFYEALLSTPEFKQKILHSTSGSGASFMKNISKANLLQIPVPKVSFQDQAEFTTFAMKVKTLKAKSTQKLQLLTELQASLQTRAFQGLL